MFFFWNYSSGTYMYRRNVCLKKKVRGVSFFLRQRRSELRSELKVGTKVGTSVQKLSGDPNIDAGAHTHTHTLTHSLTHTTVSHCLTRNELKNIKIE